MIREALNGLAIVLWLLFLAAAGIALCVAAAVAIILASEWAVYLTGGLAP